ncbi:MULTISPECIES: dipeptide/oligopeptide/nickel ABC transporter permease/ATP-binding protein [unclassified Microbacterium]|uniref:dipeptide/oligopeptide/nickel ABC transporter permease/ATP-binding protein n=1 Tax=unclassified Microbacterium TaxID=2609290 RepID=UPI00214BD954|nr:MULTISPECIES: dipeptide/oligopeptide/nickel ABC transporter permease/ATP-binding protein [unclassified Microbacterium]MCR2783540.1 dipeptide/oligopeptide/nickel ABC transporter permease/ATP-binding protein [Microbacterium sp. zg.B96]WIM15599.1 dipeptide/oligopeptide/nickel ABC transporter permease/ATP-binding protein [Microbacterium sp. zg-B96]
MTVYDPADSIVANEIPDLTTRKRAGAFRRLLRKPLGLGSLVVLLAIVLLGLFEPLLSTHDPMYASLDHINAAPGTPGWPLGGDQYGRDIWARVLTSINVSVISALIGAGVGVAVGSVFGLIAGYVGKRTDAIASWVFNLLMTFPALILVMVLYPVMGSSYQGMMFIFGLFLAPGIFRLVRNLVEGVRNELYVDAARVSGLSNWRILSRHVFYIVRGPVIISASFLASSAIGVQAGLAFLGFGSTQTPSFGSMTNDAFINIYSQPIQLVWPALFLALLNGGLILLGNAYRDVLAGPQSTVKKKRSLAAAVPEPAADPDAAAETMRGGLLSVRNLRVQYPMPDGNYREVVRGVSLDVNPGEIVGVVGESGSGKTQTAFSILGLLPKEARITADELTLAGDSLLGKSPGELRKLRGGVISYIPQEPMANLDPSFTVGSQLMEGLTKSMSRKEAKDSILALLERVGIPDPRRTFASYPHQISGGMAQRVLIAGAVVSRPKLLIADEPTTALDVTVQAEILDLLRELQGELGMGVLLVTHNFGVIADLADRVVVMRDGELVEEGPVREIFQSPKQRYTQELVGAILDEDVVREDLPVTAAAGEGRK